jgi:hypothetical protein
VRTARERRLRCIALRHDDRTDPAACERVDQRQRARHGPHRPVEPELAEHGDAVESTLGQRARGEQQPERDRELETGPGLAYAARCEVDGDPLLRPGEVRREQRGAHALARLANCGVGKADHVISGESARDVDLDGDDLPVDAEECCADHRGEHGDLQVPGAVAPERLAGRTATATAARRTYRSGVTADRRAGLRAWRTLRRSCGTGDPSVGGVKGHAG